ncbi:MAG TPA: hypothetical protein VGN29_13850 [Solirubrobacteraceae bacterium]|nr:hypothetical protein [Solirubrobacteraceae bacterium]
MSSSSELELAEADARYIRERVALLRAKLYGRGLGSSARLELLERESERSERRLRELRSKQPR